MEVSSLSKGGGQMLFEVCIYTWYQTVIANDVKPQETKIHTSQLSPFSDGAIKTYNRVKIASALCWHHMIE